MLCSLPQAIFCVHYYKRVTDNTWYSHYNKYNMGTTTSIVHTISYCKPQTSASIPILFLRAPLPLSLTPLPNSFRSTLCIWREKTSWNSSISYMYLQTQRGGVSVYIQYTPLHHRQSFGGSLRCSLVQDDTAVSVLSLVVVFSSEKRWLPALCCCRYIKVRVYLFSHQLISFEEIRRAFRLILHSRTLEKYLFSGIFVYNSYGRLCLTICLVFNRL